MDAASAFFTASAAFEALSSAFCWSASIASAVVSSIVLTARMRTVPSETWMDEME